MEAWIQSVLQWLALPQFGLSTLFLVAFISATLLPLGSEPAVVGLLQLNPDLFWQAILVATAGNTLGGALNWWMGVGARKAWNATQTHKRNKASEAFAPKAPRKLSRHERKARIWLRKLGPKACLLSWLPIIGDPLCAVAGWLQLPLLPCLIYMAVGKFCRYVFMTWAILAVIPGTVS